MTCQMKCHRHEQPHRTGIRARYSCFHTWIFESPTLMTNTIPIPKLHIRQMGDNVSI